MPFTEKLQKLQRINRMILRKTVGTPQELAARLAISPRKFYRMLNELKDFGVNILYDRTQHLYYYEDDDEARRLLPF